MGNIRIGCQTYTWQMSGAKYLDKLSHIIEIASRAGFAGLEPETQFLGRLWDPGLMKEALAANHIELAALTLVEDWLHPEETGEERAHADQTIEFLQSFPATVLAIVQMPGKDRADLRERQENLLKCVDAIAKRAHDQGLTCTYHPNSPGGSVVRTAEDYEFFLNGLDQSVIGYAPDVGHIAKVGMDPLAIIQQYRSMVNHVHYKDMNSDGVWAAMGDGKIDFVGITAYLRDTGYKGWIIIEDECPRAVDEPDEVTMEDGVYVKKHLLPIVTSLTQGPCRPPEERHIHAFTRKKGIAMKRVIVTGKKQAGIGEGPDPKAKEDWVVVKVHVAPMCTEYKAFAEGTNYEHFGHEAAGEVVEVAQPGKVKVGDRVVVMPTSPCGKCVYCLEGEYIHCQDMVNFEAFHGSRHGSATMAQLLVKQDRMLVPIPDGVSYEHAGMACCGLGPTFGAFQSMAVDRYDTVLITGLGPVGLGGVVNAHYRGARAIGVDANQVARTTRP